MAPDESGLRGPDKPRSGDEVVITGISGLFPSSENTTQFAENLFNQVDMVTKDDLNFQHPEAPKYYGKIDGITKFDAQFFKIVYQNAISMDPLNKKLLEQAYMAMYDSGINPLAYKGRKVGVFIGTSFSDTSNMMMYNSYRNRGNALSGCAKTMYANRISFWIDGKGPSYALDCSSASSMVCLEHAYEAMTKGECDAAIVGGTNLCLEPHLGLNLRKCGMVCLDGKTKCFDKNGDGYVRSDAISCIFLQKAKDAKRIYAQLCFAQSEYGLKGHSLLPVRNTMQIEKFLSKFYLEIDVSPKEVEYIEAEASGIAEADANELEAIANVFAKDKPVKVGSVKSNMGNSEPASGVCALTKVLLAYHRGKLPGNLHYSEPLDISPVKDGKIEVLKNNINFNRGYTAVNNFDFNGTNCHALLKGRYKPKDISKYKCDIPRLVPISARQEAGINKISNILKNQPIDPEVIGMLHNIYKIDTSGHTCRGYTIIDTNENNETVCLAESFEYYSGAKRPLWLVFSGMGSQWPGMAAELMKIPVFANAIHKCHKALEPYGVDLIKVITEPDKTTFDTILNCFIGISAVQIGLTDVLKAIGIVPDNIIGHSQGEMGCAYFDNCFTTEGIILGAYSRGLVSSKSKFVKGAMAAVGMGYKDILPLLPPEIDVACHNSNESATLSGPYEDIQNFVAELSAKKIFAREVSCTNIPFHSRYIAHAGPAFLERMGKIIKEPIPRSEKWISTSIPQEKWHEPLAKYSSPEYHANNMLSPVLFEEAATLIPDNAVVVEVAPHGLLQAILKRSHPECVHIPLTRRGHQNQVQFLLDALGKIYQQGYNLNIEALYPPIEYPVATETQMISHFVEWEHSEHWPEYIHNSEDLVKTAAREYIMSIHDDEHQFLTGYVRDGNNVFPEAAILKLVWETFGMYKGKNYKELSVMFKDIQFYGEVFIKSEEPLKLNIMINKGNDYFEVNHNSILLASGYIVNVAKPSIKTFEANGLCEDNITDLNTDDVYKCLYAKGLMLKGEFQSILETNFNKTEAVVKWKDDWVLFLDALLQLCVLARDSENKSKLKIIKKIVINLDEHEKEKMLSHGNETRLKAQFGKLCNVLRCGGVELRDITFDEQSNEEQQPDVLESLTFVPHCIVGEIDMDTALSINLKLIAYNILVEEIKIIEIVNDSKPYLAEIIRDVANKIPTITVDIQSVNVKKFNKTKIDASLIVFQNLLTDGIDIDSMLNHIDNDTFVLAFDKNISLFKNGNFNVLSSMTVQGIDMKLLRKRYTQEEDKTYITLDYDDNFAWVPKLQSELQKTKRVVLVSERQPQCGLFGLVKKISKEYKNKISLVLINDYHASTFSPKRAVYEKQMSKNLIFNIFQKGQWGCYYNLPTTSPTEIQNFRLVNTVVGDIDSLRWTESPAVSQRNNLVQVCYAGPSQRDSKKLVGLVGNYESGFGMDFSGIDSNGDRVMGLVQNGALASTVHADPDLLWPVPNHWSLEEAATVPLPFVHAYYCLAIRAQVMKRHSVFINGGAGALGQAVISMCLSLNCKVYTSVSNNHKKRFLLKLFPQLEEKNIGCSQNGDYCDMVAVNTKGKKCDIVINCASGASREAAMKCVAIGGVILDVNDYDPKHNKPFGMCYGEKERSYIATNMSSIFRAENLKEKKMIQIIIAQGIINGSVRPLSRVVYPTTEISSAFRLLSANKHRGRVIIKIKNAEISAKALNIIPRHAYSANGVYIVACDNTELGPELASRLVRRGARKLILHLPSKNVSGYLHTKFESWMKQGVRVKLSTEDICIDKKCLQLLRDAEKMGKVQGIIIIHENSNKDSWSREDFMTTYDKTISLVANLDVMSRNNCPELSVFAVLSRSSQSVIDEYANSVFDKICRERLRVGLPSIFYRIERLDELQSNHSREARLQPQNIETVLNALETSLKLKQTSSVTTYNLKKRRSAEFLENFLRTIGIKNINEVDQELLIGGLLVNDINVEELRKLIRNNLNIEIGADKLRNISIASLKALCETRLQEDTKSTSGLGAFYTFVSHDEFMATDVMVQMRTLCSKNDKTTELDGSAAHLMLIPGFDGQHDVFNLICERLKIRAMTFQLGPDIVKESIVEMASSIIKYIKKTFTFDSKFYLLGYSFGVNVALEVASFLEQEGYRGVVYCLESSPDALKAQLKAHIGTISDDELQNLILRHMSKLMVEDQSIELEELEQIQNWPDKVDFCINKLRGLVSYTRQYLTNVLESAYYRILSAKSYNTELKLESQIVLIKGKAHPRQLELDSDYGLSKYTKKPVKVFDIKLDHASAPKDCRVSNIVNKLIDPKLIEKYNNMNLCDTYLLE